MKVSSQNALQQTLMKDFKKFDTNGDNFITDKEIKAMANKPMTLDNMGNVMTAQLLDQSPDIFDYFDNRQYGQTRDKKIGMGDLQASAAGERSGAAKQQGCDAGNKSALSKMNDQMMSVINEVYSMIMSIIADIQNTFKDLGASLSGKNNKES